VTSAPDLIDDAAVAALRAHPGFRGACEREAQAAKNLYFALSPALRWFARDMGRFHICAAAWFLDMAGLLTIQTLTAGVGHASSPGRVAAFLRRAEAAGVASIDADDGPRRQRRLRLDDALYAIARDRACSGFVSALALAPDAAEISVVLADEALFVQFALAALAHSIGRPEFSFDRGDAIDRFAHAEAGFLMLYDLQLRQPPDRARLLEAAPLSRWALSRDYGVSRAHINRLLADSSHVQASEDRIVFHPALSDDLERHFAASAVAAFAGARAVLGGWRFGQASEVSRSA
jgi:hypothetical protein